MGWEQEGLKKASEIFNILDQHYNYIFSLKMNNNIKKITINYDVLNFT